MKLVRWLRFTWELKNLPEFEALPEAHYRIRRAVKEEAHTVKNALISAFTLDADWNDTLHVLREVFERQIEDAFDEKEIPCLVLMRGPQVVGASVLSMGADDENHLISGPAILNEYRNRGLGAALLYESLRTLRDAGLSTAFGVTKGNAPTAKFLYTKYNSVQSPYEMEHGLAAAG